MAEKKEKRCGCKERRAKIAKMAKDGVSKASKTLDEVMKKIYGENYGS